MTAYEIDRKLWKANVQSYAEIIAVMNRIDCSPQARRQAIWYYRLTLVRAKSWSFSPEGSVRAEENARQHEHLKNVWLRSRAWPGFHEAITFCGFEAGDDDPRVINGSCVVCSVKLTGRRKVFCSDECGNKLHGRVYMNTNWIRRAVVKRRGPDCASCGTHIASSLVDGGPEYPEYEKIDIDHILALKDGGTNHIDNLQVLCKDCHKEKTRFEARKRSSRVHKEFPVPTPSLEGIS